MSKKIKSACLLIRRQPYRESSSLLHVFSATHGFISVLAKGIYKDNRQSAMLNVLNEYEVVLTQPTASGLFTLCEMSLMDEYPTDLPTSTWFCAQAGVEILSKIILPAEDIPVYYKSLKLYLTYLTGVVKNPIVIFWRFMLHVCKLLGVQINLGECSHCAKGMNMPGGYAPDHGRMICHQCVLELPVSYHLTHEAGYIISLLPVIGNFINDITVSEKEIKQINHFFLHYLNGQFHKNIVLKSLEYFE